MLKYYSTKCYKHLIYSIINHLYTQHVKNGMQFFMFFQKQFYRQCLRQHHHHHLSLSTTDITAQQPCLPSLLWSRLPVRLVFSYVSVAEI